MKYHIINSKEIHINGSYLMFHYYYFVDINEGSKLSKLFG